MDEVKMNELISLEIIHKTLEHLEARKILADILLVEALSDSSKAKILPRFERFINSAPENYQNVWQQIGISKDEDKLFASMESILSKRRNEVERDLLVLLYSVEKGVAETSDEVEVEFNKLNLNGQEVTMALVKILRDDLSLEYPIYFVVPSNVLPDITKESFNNSKEEFNNAS